MEVKFDADPVLTKSDQDALTANLDITPAQLQDALNNLALAATAELLDMTTARDPQKLSSETALRRLEYLIRYYYKDRLPTETEIAQLFQVPTSRAKTWLTNLHAERRSAIEKQEAETIARTLRTGKKKKDKITVELTVSSEYVYGAIKNVIATRATGLRTIEKQRGSVDTYEMGIDTFNAIAPVFGVAELK